MKILVQNIKYKLSKVKYTPGDPTMDGIQVRHNENRRQKILKAKLL